MARSGNAREEFSEWLADSEPELIDPDHRKDGTARPTRTAKRMRLMRDCMEKGFLSGYKRAIEYTNWGHEGKEEDDEESDDADPDYCYWCGAERGPLELIAAGMAWCGECKQDDE